MKHRVILANFSTFFCQYPDIRVTFAPTFQKRVCPGSSFSLPLFQSYLSNNQISPTSLATPTTTKQKHKHNIPPTCTSLSVHSFTYAEHTHHSHSTITTPSGSTNNYSNNYSFTLYHRHSHSTPVRSSQVRQQSIESYTHHYTSSHMLHSIFHLIHAQTLLYTYYYSTN